MSCLWSYSLVMSWVTVVTVTVLMIVYIFLLVYRIDILRGSVELIHVASTSAIFYIFFIGGIHTQVSSIIYSSIEISRIIWSLVSIHDIHMGWPLKHIRRLCLRPIECIFFMLFAPV